MTSALACAPQVVVPQIEYKSHAVVRAEYPDCTAEIEAVQGAETVTHQMALDLALCYRSMWKICDTELQVLTTSVEAMQAGGADAEQ